MQAVSVCGFSVHHWASIVGVGLLSRVPVIRVTTRANY